MKVRSIRAGHAGSGKLIASAALALLLVLPIEAQAARHHRHQNQNNIIQQAQQAQSHGNDNGNSGGSSSGHQIQQAMQQLIQQLTQIIRQLEQQVQQILQQLQNQHSGGGSSSSGSSSGITSSNGSSSGTSSSSGMTSSSTSSSSGTTSSSGSRYKFQQLRRNLEFGIKLGRLVLERIELGNIEFFGHDLQFDEFEFRNHVKFRFQYRLQRLRRNLEFGIKPGRFVIERIEFGNIEFFGHDLQFDQVRVPEPHQVQVPGTGSSSSGAISSSGSSSGGVTTGSSSSGTVGTSSSSSGMTSSSGSSSGTTSSSSGTASSGSSSGGITTTNGACGPASAQTLNAAPTTGLCNAGTPTAVTTDGGSAWLWQCQGTNGGNTDGCFAFKGSGSSSSSSSGSSSSGSSSNGSSSGTGGSSGITTSDGTCGPANNQTFSSAPTANLCGAGTPTAVMLVGDSWIWQCEGTNGGNTDGCTATASNPNGGGPLAFAGPCMQTGEGNTATVNCFINAIGVNQHLGWIGTSFDNMLLELSELEYLGINHVRDVPAGYDVDEFITLAQQGIKFGGPSGGCQCDMSGGEIQSGELPPYDQLEQAVPGSVTHIEGPNELNGQTVYWQGANTVGNPGGAVGIQQALYAGIKSDPILAPTVPVVNNSIVDCCAGWQDYVNAEGNMSAYADIANWHVYASGGPSFAAFEEKIPWAEQTVPNKPFYITEFGYASEWLPRIRKPIGCSKA